MKESELIELVAKECGCNTDVVTNIYEALIRCITAALSVEKQIFIYPGFGSLVVRERSDAKKVVSFKASPTLKKNLSTISEKEQVK